MFSVIFFWILFDQWMYCISLLLRKYIYNWQTFFFVCVCVSGIIENLTLQVLVVDYSYLKIS